MFNSAQHNRAANYRDGRQQSVSFRLETLDTEINKVLAGRFPLSEYVSTIDV